MCNVKGGTMSPNFAILFSSVTLFYCLSAHCFVFSTHSFTVFGSVSHVSSASFPAAGSVAAAMKCSDIPAVFSSSAATYSHLYQFYKEIICQLCAYRCFSNKKKVECLNCKTKKMHDCDLNAKLSCILQTLLKHTKTIWRGIPGYLIDTPLILLFCCTLGLGQVTPLSLC